MYYAGNYIYKKGNFQGQQNVALTFFNSEEGYVEPEFDLGKPDKIIGFNYTYQYKDHLGNIRLSYEDLDENGTIDPLTEIKEENHYYPFGLKHKGYNNGIVGSKFNYKTYQGQEFTEDLGLNIYEWKYRVSDPAIGRFWQIDPLGETYHWMTTYQFASNQPIHANEIEGLENKRDKSLMNRTENPTSSSRHSQWTKFRNDMRDFKKTAKKVFTFAFSWIPGVGDVPDPEREESDSGGYKFIDDSGNASGETHLIRKTKGDVEEVNAEGLSRI